MKRDDIINLMQQACDPDKKPAWHNGFWTITQLELDLFVDLVLKAERKPLNEEPVAWMYTTPLSGNRTYVTLYATELTLYKADKVTPLYTAPPQREWQELTNEEIELIKGSANRAIGYIRVTAAKLKEKNT
jgi:hypothetical protein